MKPPTILSNMYLLEGSVTITLYSVYNRIKDRLFYFIRAYYCLVDRYTPILKGLSDL